MCMGGCMHRVWACEVVYAPCVWVCMHVDVHVDVYVYACVLSAGEGGGERESR
jgi:hypothetical protein